MKSLATIDTLWIFSFQQCFSCSRIQHPEARVRVGLEYHISFFKCILQRLPCLRAVLLINKCSTDHVACISPSGSGSKDQHNESATPRRCTFDAQKERKSGDSRVVCVIDGQNRVGGFGYPPHLRRDLTRQSTPGQVEVEGTNTVGKDVTGRRQGLGQLLYPQQPGYD